MKGISYIIIVVVQRNMKAKTFLRGSFFVIFQVTFKKLGPVTFLSCSYEKSFGILFIQLWMKYCFRKSKEKKKRKIERQKERKKENGLAATPIAC